ncbi:MAG: hypothetical protein AB7S38_09195 [Vulcanimicrobiota bacterium]
MRLTHLLAMVLLLLATGLRTSTAIEPTGTESGLSLLEYKARDPVAGVSVSPAQPAPNSPAEFVFYGRVAVEKHNDSPPVPEQRGPSRAPPGPASAWNNC